MATANRKGTARSKKGKTEVPGQALGYGLQYTLLTLRLLEAPEGSYCSMEYLDDVAEQSGEILSLVQSKSALTANPVSDRAKSLWKTFSNWVKLIPSAGYDLQKTSFEIYVSRPAGGQIVEAFANADNKKTAREAIEAARLTLWGNAPAFELRGDVAEEIAKYVENVFNADSDLLEQIVCNFRLSNGSGSPQADIEAVIRSHPVSSSRVPDIADHMCGVVKRRVDELLESGAPAIISRDAFYDWYGAYLRKVDRDTVLLSHAKLPSERESRDQLPKIFVQQLDLIGLPFEDKLEAASDYLMASADRTAWAISGEVDASSLEELDAGLKRSWKNKRRLCGIQYEGKADEVKGQALYSECMELAIPLQTMQTPDHFVPGCFHRLADDMSVGWHPTFDSLLKSKGSV